MKIKDLSLYDPDTPWLDYINIILSREIVQVSQNHRIKMNLRKLFCIQFSFNNLRFLQSFKKSLMLLKKETNSNSINSFQFWVMPLPDWIAAEGHRRWV